MTDSQPSWLQPPPTITENFERAIRSHDRPKGKPTQTKAQAFEAKAETARTAAEEKLKAGTCPQCATVVLYSRTVGLLDVVDAVPIQEPEWTYVAAGRTTYIVVDNRRLKRATYDARRFWPKAPIHAEHTACGKIVPVPVELAKTPRDYDGDVEPPFDVGLLAPLGELTRVSDLSEQETMKSWRCFNCNEIIEPDEQAFAVTYNGPRSSYYITRCAKQCETKLYGPQTAGKKPRYPKINKLTGEYEEPKKGEVLPDE